MDLAIFCLFLSLELIWTAARDICHYRWGFLNPTTIRDLMMIMCTSRFEMEEQQLAFG